MRLDKFLCECGLGTRSEVKKIIKTGQIICNGETVTSPDFKVDELSDMVKYKGNLLEYEKFSYYLFHKPAGCVTAKTDHLHKTVMDFLPEPLSKDCSPVGRLDLDTEGLLLITNDGALAHHLLNPSHHIPKTYYLVTDKAIPLQAEELFQTGIDIGDEKPALPARLEVIEQNQDMAGLDGNSTYLTKFEEMRHHWDIAVSDRHSAYLTIVEGRFHQVKRMMQAVGCEVLYLKRISMGKLTLSDLPVGGYRKLTEDEINLLKSR